MIKAWQGVEVRPTKDIDFLARVNNSIPNLKQIMKEIATIEGCEDGIIFDVDQISAESITRDAEYLGVRVILRGVFGKIPVRVQIDCGFGDAITPPPEWFHYPALLNLGAPYVQGYQRETLIAEKFQAMVELAEFNTRMKDFFDIWLLASKEEFEGQSLAAAIRATFNRRAMTIPLSLPIALTPAFFSSKEKEQQWRAFLANGGLREMKFAEVIEVIIEFLMPVSKAIAAGEAFDKRWQRGIGSSKSWS